MSIAVDSGRHGRRPLLDPASRLAEVLFGLIMTLGFTLSASVLLHEQGLGGARELLIAIFGCNAAWGVIDGALYILGAIVERARRRKIWLDARAARTEAEAEAIVADELDELVGSALETSQRHELYRSVSAKLREEEPPSLRLRREDFLGALASCALVFGAGLPAAVPFLFVSDPIVALRISNALLLLLLLGIGVRTARSLGMPHPLRMGFALLAIGVALVAVAIALGG